MEVDAYLVADPEALELVEPGEGALDDPAGPVQTGAMGGALRAIFGVMPRARRRRRYLS